MTSPPAPRRRLGRSPKGRPTTRRRRGTSGNVCRSRAGTFSAGGRRSRRADPVGRGSRRQRETAFLDDSERRVAAESARLGQERRRQQEPVTEDRQEQGVDVVGQ